MLTMALLLTETLQVDGSLRQFSVSTPRRGDHDFDDDDFDDDFDDFGDFEDFTEKKQDLSSMIRQRSAQALEKEKLAKRQEEERIMKLKQEQEARASKQRRDLATRAEQTLQGVEEFVKVGRQEFNSVAKLVADRKEQTRREKEERRRYSAHKRFMRQYHDLMTRAAALSNVDQSFFEELYYIKYPRAAMIESRLSMLQRRFEECEHQYRTCKSALKICDLQSERALLERQLADVEQQLKSIANHIHGSFVVHIVSARKRIDKLLRPKFAHIHAYVESQNTAFKLSTNSKNIGLLLKDLASQSPRYQHLQEMFKDTKPLLRSLHTYRYWARQSRFYQPLGETQVHQLASNLDRYGWKTFGIEANRTTLKWPLPRMIASSLAYWYLPRWSSHSPRDPELDITWRYLDVLHPFDVARVRDTSIVQMVATVVHMLTYDNPPSSNSNARANLANSLFKWNTEFQLTAGTFESAVLSLRYITWVRLITESKIHALGEVPETISRGLFCSPNPLSQDLRKFFEYTHTFASLMELSTLGAREMKLRRKGRWVDIPTRRLLLLKPPKSERLRLRRSSKTSVLADRGRKRFGHAVPRAENIKGKTKKTTRNSDTSEKPPSAEPPNSSNSPDVAEELKAPVNGTDEKSYPTVDEEVLVMSEPRDSQSISSQSPTPQRDNSAQFWSHKNHKGQSGQGITVHYCRTFESAERVAKLFSESRVIGLDLEWKAQALSTAGIKSNLSLLQIADQNRIALFHIALFQTKNHQELTPPSLKILLESADIVKVGVNIKADCTRVRRYLGIEVQSQLELSHLYKLVKHSQSNPKLINRRVVNLSQQVEEILGLPLYKEDNVRCSDWSRPLSYTQVQYAASDPFACLCLYHALELKRKALNPIPPPPAYAELNLPILVSSDGDEPKVKGV
ncbi:hypothetical protein PISL3812_06855 [Talaromyces islandicus]|uniref:3'-5' exonuclease domain-containing protein n=1 Tax=Talaromyces islandicus TaxID=28573 RepID=A0A0U1M470_TALIS|nr:hypothetical protein PISL3812_06855 [Talaromyces islandicus]